MPSHSEESGAMLGAHYRLLEVVGRGAMGDVWKAVDSRSNTVVAAKVLRAEHMDDPDLINRFMRERSILLNLRGPGLVSVLDLVVDDGKLGIVMEFIPGGSLRRELELRSTFAPALALRVCARVLTAVELAHSSGVVHRDIKPDNVLLSQKWTRVGVRDIHLSDFGIAGLVTDGTRRTSSGIIGTPEYMSPELISSGHSGPAGDVYGVGVLLYELLSGRTPFAGDGNDFTVAHRHVTMSPPVLPVDPELWKLLSRMLAKAPSARPSASEAAAAMDELAAVLNGVPALAAPNSTDGYSPTYHRATVDLKHPFHSDARVTVSPTAGPSSPSIPADDIEHSVPDLGEPTSHTLHRPLSPGRATEVDDAEGVEPGRTSKRLMRPLILSMVAVAALVTVGIVMVNALRSHDFAQSDAPTAVSITASENAQTSPAGLGMSWTAESDPASGDVRLSITISAENAPLEGAFLTILPPIGDEQTCPSVLWDDEASVSRNVPSVTGVSSECGWSIEPGVVAARSQSTLTATITPDEPFDAVSLSEWVRSIAAATHSATADPDVKGSAYPAQRLTSVQVRVANSVVTSSPLTVTLVPVWPSGPDELNPIYVSPSSGRATSVLTAVAGGVQGVSFADGCAGSLVVATDGRTVSTVGASSSCVLRAQVGNFLNLTSNTFSIVNSGS